MPAIDRNGKIQVQSEKFLSQDNMLKILYDTVFGRCILKFLTMPVLSEAVGKFMDSELSKPLIKPFIRKNNINLSEYYTDNIKS